MITPHLTVQELSLEPQQKRPSSRKKRANLVIEVDEEPQVPDFSEEISKENKSTDKREKSSKDFLLNPSKFDKENAPPNVKEGAGRLSHQPTPNGSLKTTPFTESSKDDLSRSTSAKPSVSIVTRKVGGRMSNTHEPITVRGNKTKI